MTEFSNEDIAQVLDRAHDELLVRGWCQNRGGTPDGRVCLFGAVGVVTGAAVAKFIGEVDSRFTAASDSLQAQHFTANWNDEPDRTIDDVLDAYRITAKQLREDAP